MKGACFAILFVSVASAQFVFPGESNGSEVKEDSRSPRIKPRLPDHLLPAELPCLPVRECPALMMILIENSRGVDEFDSCGTTEDGFTLYRCPKFDRPKQLVGCRCTTVRKCPALFALALRRKFEELKKFDRCGFADGEMLLCCPVGQKRIVESEEEGVRPIDARINTDGQSFDEERPNNTLEEKHEDASLNTVCGFQSAVKIFGGINADSHEYPWAAALAYINAKTDSRQYLCGGTLISPQYVLTAAHCISSKNGHLLSKVRVGHSNLNSAEGGKDADIISIVIHPQFRLDPHLINDLALLKLSEPLKATSVIRPICLPPRVRTEEIVAPTVIGWGLTENGTTTTRLQELELGIISNEDCLEEYRSRISTFQLSESQICASGLVKGSDSCKGDSGGPLMYLNSNSQWEIIGVTSFGTIRCDSSIPGVYTRVARHLGWIGSVINSA
jgi:hypothetical protein